MLSTFSDMQGASLSGTDDSVGSLHDLLFDAPQWVVRYLVVDVGRWLPGRRVLLPPAVLESADWSAGMASVPLSRKQVEDSPGVESDRPVSRQKEVELFEYYDMPFYWGPIAQPLAGGEPPPIPLGTTVPVDAARPESTPETDSPNLRSCSEVINYAIEADDDSIGHVEDFVLDDHSWSIRYLVIDTRNWLPGRKVMVAPQWIERISWTEAAVHIAMTRQQILDSPKFDPSRPIEREYEQRLHEHYDRPGYWMM
ncbi:PRC-barrel domain-containing protein [Roseimaritima sediminicola]|uniref:PRC-barrel domain-containing protein n=1 Tax=Roseimaritima sediminicola TaxID=2662066 RepID=UPI0012984DFE|nr:PRC-barrel domain-containing protein [Roseimaritima sediminicola]